MARPRTSTEFSVSELESMLNKRRKRIAKLEKERTKLLAKVADLDAQIHEAGGDLRTRGGRVRNEKSLNETMVDVFKTKNGPMKVAEIADAVLATGYKTNSANFRGIVNQTLIKDKRFASTGARGSYALKKTA